MHLHRIAQQRRVNIDEIIRVNANATTTSSVRVPNVNMRRVHSSSQTRHWGGRVPIHGHRPFCCSVRTRGVFGVHRRVETVVVQLCARPAVLHHAGMVSASRWESEPPVVGKRKWRFVRMLLNCG